MSGIFDAYRRLAPGSVLRINFNLLAMPQKEEVRHVLAGLNDSWQDDHELDVRDPSKKNDIPNYMDLEKAIALKDREVVLLSPVRYNHHVYGFASEEQLTIRVGLLNEKRQWKKGDVTLTFSFRTADRISMKKLPEIVKDKTEKPLVLAERHKFG